MVKARDNRIWIGCEAGRVMIFDPKVNRFTKAAPRELDLRTVPTTTEDKNGNIRFGTQHGLIVKYDISTQRFVHFAEQLYRQKRTYGK
jgi:ligand-binding sensor domain-containing protein